MKTISYYLKPEEAKGLEDQKFCTIENVIGIRFSTDLGMVAIEYLDENNHIQNANFDLDVFEGDLIVR